MSKMKTKDVAPQKSVSNEIQELISYRPHWVIRRGNTLFFSILLFLLMLTWFIKYPDLINGSLKLAAIDGPKILVAKKEGKLQKILVANEQEVRTGQPLAFLQSTANHLQVLALQELINEIKPAILIDSLEVLLTTPFPLYDQLGEVQLQYQDFQNILKETLQVLSNGYYQQKKLALRQDLQYLAAIRTNSEIQKELINQDYALQQKEYSANESLAKDKVIAEVELNQNKSKIIGKQQVLFQMDAQMITNDMEQHSKKKEILELLKYITDQQQKFRSAFFTLKSKLEEWADESVIVAPESGKVMFISFLQENQLVSNEQELFYIQPAQSIYYGQLLTSQNGLGKIKNGQSVLIRVESYPSNEFGYLKGVIAYISNMPTKRDSFLIKVDLPNGLTTNYNKTIFFRNNLSAEAEVITDSRRLLQRFIGQFRNLGKR